jgi:TPP-dependent 2-oxoacid decarboxylase
MPGKRTRKMDGGEVSGALPVSYFHIVFTLPHELSALTRLLYDLLFRTSAATLLELARDPKHLGAEIGFLGVLHTWGQNLQQNPQHGGEIERVERCMDTKRGCEGLTHAWLWPRLGYFVCEGDVVIAECGCSQAGLAGVRLPACTTFISQTTWGSIGCTLPALLGSLLAAPHRRHLLFIGDGSLQMTVQELSTILRHGLKPIILLLNNLGYTIERMILGPGAEYNDIQNWKYVKLAEVLADGQAGADFYG